MSYRHWHTISSYSHSTHHSWTTTIGLNHVILIMLQLHWQSFSVLKYLLCSFSRNASLGNFACHHSSLNHVFIALQNSDLDYVIKQPSVLIYCVLHPRNINQTRETWCFAVIVDTHMQVMAGNSNRYPDIYRGNLYQYFMCSCVHFRLVILFPAFRINISVQNDVRASEDINGALHHWTTRSNC